MWNQIQAGTSCREVAKEDLFGGKKICGPTSLSSDPNRNLTPDRLFEESVFLDAARTDVKKNNCQIQKMKLISGKGAYRNEWTAQVVQSWLTQKTATLFKERCVNIFYRRIEPADAKRLGIKKAFEKVLQRERKMNPNGESDFQKSYEKYGSDCLDEKTFAALSRAGTIAKNSVPVVSLEPAFKILDKNRHLIINERTGAPLTDGELLKESDRYRKSKAADWGFLNFSKAQPIFKKLDDFVVELAADKTKMNEKLNAPEGRLSDDVKDYLYQNGSMNEALAKSGLYKNEDGSPNRGAVCLVARYEPNMLAEVVEIVGTTAIGAGAIKVALGSKKLLETYRIAKYVESHSLGTSAMAVANARAFKRCFSSAMTTKGAKSIGGAEYGSHMEGIDQIKKVASYEKWDLAFKPEEIPACQDIEVGNAIAREDQQRHCILEEQANGLPFKTGIVTLIVNEGM